MLNLRGGALASRVPRRTNFTFLVIAGLFTFVQFLAFSSTVSAVGRPDDGPKVTVCHRTNSASNPYSTIEVPYSAFDGDEENDHSQHIGAVFNPAVHNQQNRTWGDIVPQVDGVTDGLNWTEEGQIILRNDCNLPDDNQEEPCTEGPGFASYVVDFEQGTTKNGSGIPEERSDPDHAVGAPDVSEPTIDGFFSLGFGEQELGGWIVVGFDGYVMNVKGDDLSFHEATFGNRQGYGEETALVEVSQNGTDWEVVGTANNHDTNGAEGVTLLDFDATGFDWIRYVRLSDTSDPANFGSGNADGYDLDAVDAVFISCEDPEPPEPCTVSVFSDTTNTVEEKDDAYAMELSYVHPAWTASIDGATWIWGDDPVVDTTVNETQTFVNTFGWNGPVISAVLDVASDNWYEVYVNGVHVGGDSSDNNFQLATQDSYDISAYVVTGENTLKIVTTNKGVAGSNARSNPAGLLYSAVVTGSDEDCDEPPEPVTIAATKVVCEAEEYLPNWGGRNEGPDSIEENTAERWVNASQGNCWLARWQFQWAPGDAGNPGDQMGEAGEPWTTFHGHVELFEEDLEETDRIWIREVFQEGYVPFSGANQTENYSAELYCGNDVLNYDNFDYLQNPEPGATYYCVAFNAEELSTFEIVADKVICSEEQYLPNWGDGEPVEEITFNTAQRWVNASEGECWFAEEWEFQWAPNTSNPGDNEEYAGEPWTVFSGSVELGEEDLDGDRIWIREVLPEGWLGFGGANTTEDWSAELYCGNDVLNYDNFDYLLNPEVGETYYCAAFNTEAIGQISGLLYADLGEGADGNNAVRDVGEEALEGWDVWLLTRNSPYTVRAIDTTIANGSFLFDGLPFGTYYVCQDLEEGWTQTQLNYAGNNGVDPSAPSVGTVLDLDDAVVADYCYMVELTEEEPVAVNRDFGNYNTILGVTDDREVLGDTDGEVLAATGDPAALLPLVGLLLISVPVGVSRKSRIQE